MPLAGVNALTGAMGAFTSAEIWQRVQCTRPEIIGNSRLGTIFKYYIIKKGEWVGLGLMIMLQ